MAIKGTLYTYPDNFRAHKALIAARYSGAAVAVCDKFEFGQTNQSKDFLKKFPLGKVPAFEGSDGFCLFESNAIAHYLATDELRGGADPATKALVQQWIGFVDSEILPAACSWVFSALNVLSQSAAATDAAKKDLLAALAALNNHLLHNTYLAGERVTLADVSAACTLALAYQNVLEPAVRKPFGNVNRWFNTVVNQPNVRAVLGEVKLCVKAGADAGAVAKPKKEEKKAAKKAEEPAGGDAALAPAPKPKDPLDALPKGSWDMDDFKRFYSNNDEDKSVPYFWEKFDPEHYSIWRCDYKYSDELAMVFMSCNLIGGMFQRLEKLRKNAFASVCLFGENNNSTISGIWVWRGQDLAFELSEDWQIDYASYDWKKLDPKSEDTKKQVNDYFKWIGEDKGKKFNQGKIFK